MPFGSPGPLIDFLLISAPRMVPNHKLAPYILRCPSLLSRTGTLPDVLLSEEFRTQRCYTHQDSHLSEHRPKSSNKPLPASNTFTVTQPLSTDTAPSTLRHHPHGVANGSGSHQGVLLQHLAQHKDLAHSSKLCAGRSCFSSAVSRWSVARGPPGWPALGREG